MASEQLCEGKEKGGGCKGALRARPGADAQRRRPLEGGAARVAVGGSDEHEGRELLLRQVVRSLQLVLACVDDTVHVLTHRDGHKVTRSRVQAHQEVLVHVAPSKGVDHKGHVRRTFLGRAEPAASVVAEVHGRPPRPVAVLHYEVLVPCGGADLRRGRLHRADVGVLQLLRRLLEGVRASAQEGAAAEVHPVTGELGEVCAQLLHGTAVQVHVVALRQLRHRLKQTLLILPRDPVLRDGSAVRVLLLRLLLLLGLRLGRRRRRRRRHHGLRRCLLGRVLVETSVVFQPRALSLVRRCAVCARLDRVAHLVVHRGSRLCWLRDASNEVQIL
eukprot:Rhum_TRINITY_DN9682_c0_g1::Rhum_TRINITY_DN9682_c0_g1_i1::g.34662::m.34662